MEKWPKHKRQPHGDILGSKKSPLEMGHPCEHLTYLPSLGVDSLQLEELLQITDFFFTQFQWQDFQLCMYLHPISLSTFWDFHLLTYSPYLSLSDEPSPPSSTSSCTADHLKMKAWKWQDHLKIIWGWKTVDSSRKKDALSIESCQHDDDQGGLLWAGGRQVEWQVFIFIFVGRSPDRIRGLQLTSFKRHLLLKILVSHLLLRILIRPAPLSIITNLCHSL